jgi:hypothetical protein
MKQKIIDLFKLKFICETKWNLVFDGEECTLIYNKVTKEMKIKPKI